MLTTLVWLYNMNNVFGMDEENASLPQWESNEKAPNFYSNIGDMWVGLIFVFLSTSNHHQAPPRNIAALSTGIKKHHINNSWHWHSIYLLIALWSICLSSLTAAFFPVTVENCMLIILMKNYSYSCLLVLKHERSAISLLLFLVCGRHT